MKTLYNHQQAFLASNEDHAMLVWGMGAGKTRSAIEWAKKRPMTALIVCPKGLKENWRRECEMWGLKNYKIISKEEFKRDAKELRYGNVVIDEADHFFSAMFKSQLSKSLRQYIKERRPDLLLLTGTPYRSSPWNIYTAATLLGHNWNYREFKYRFFDDIFIGFRVVSAPKKGCEDDLKRLIKSISNVFNIEEGFDIPPQVDETVYVEQTKEQKLAHKMNIELSPIVQFTRMHQIEAGIGIEDDPKLELIRGYAENETKIAVVCRYREQLAKYKEALKGDHVVYEMHGDVKNRSETLDKVENSERCVLLVQSATCEGWEAPSVGLIVFASMDYSYRNYVQVRGRFLRMNRLKKNVYVHLVAGEADKAILRAMEGKADFDVLKYIRSTANP